MGCSGCVFSDTAIRYRDSVASGFSKGLGFSLLFAAATHGKMAYLFGVAAKHQHLRHAPKSPLGQGNSLAVGATPDVVNIHIDRQLSLNSSIHCHSSLIQDDIGSDVCARQTS